MNTRDNDDECKGSGWEKQQTEIAREVLTEYLWDAAHYLSLEEIAEVVAGFMVDLNVEYGFKMAKELSHDEDAKQIDDSRRYREWKNER